MVGREYFKDCLTSSYANQLVSMSARDIDAAGSMAPSLTFLETLENIGRIMVVEVRVEIEVIFISCT